MIFLHYALISVLIIVFIATRVILFVKDNSRFDRMDARLSDLTVDMKDVSRDMLGLKFSLTSSNLNQGAWGEIMLERILQNVGMIKGRDYFAQIVTANGTRPDVIVKLSSGQSVVVDSKVSLSHYSRWSTSLCKEERKALMSKHISSINSHLKQLKGRSYTESVDGSLDCVIMFMPAESALIDALKNDHDLLEKAMKENVIIVGPSGLFGLLRVLEQFKSESNLNKSVNSILNRNKQLDLRLNSLKKDCEKLSRDISRMQKFSHTILGKIGSCSDLTLEGEAE